MDQMFRSIIKGYEIKTTIKACGGEYEITDEFLSTAGSEAIKKILTMAHPRELEE